MTPAPENAPVPRILIVDDDPGQRSLLDSFLRGQGFQTVVAENGPQALEQLRSIHVQMMISDVRMPGLTGLETLRFARRELPDLPVLLVTAYADIRDAVGAMKDGALNYLAKPIDLEELLAMVQNATGVSQPRTVVFGPDRKLPANIIAASHSIRALFQEVSLIADSDSRVLITGESGVGKEVIADVLHTWSNRAKGPIVKVNCAAIPENLLESELFGHEKGSFTGAVAQRRGRFEVADGGTIFLDEVADMLPPLQAKLLRVTQSGRFSRVGSSLEIDTNVRILAATNRNLEDEVKAGRFREDLFYRLNVVELHVPPLRERPEDIIPLAESFIAEFTRGRARFSAGVADCLRSYPWPGNVRELRNAMERAALLSRGEMILPDHLPGRVRGSPTVQENSVAGVGIRDSTAGEELLGDIERQAIFQALRKHGFNRTETAKALGISRRALIYKLQRYRELGFTVDPGP